MPNPINEAREFAAVFQKAAKDGVLEKPFRAVVEAHLVEVARAAGIELVPHTEVTLGSAGRSDTIYNRFILEWKQPGLFSASNNATANSKAIAQIKGYVLVPQPPEARPRCRLLHRWSLFHLRHQTRP